MKKIITYTLSALLLVNTVIAKESVLVLRSSASLYEEKDDKNVKWASEITAGTLLEAKKSEIVKKTIKAKDKDWPDVPFYYVTYNKKNYYIQSRDSAFIENENQAAIIENPALLFSKKHFATFRNAWLDAGTIVALSGKLNENDNPPLAEVTFFDTIDKVRRTRFVQISKLSNDSKNIKALQLLEKARSIKEIELKKEFINNAKETATSSILLKFIEDQSNSMLGITTYGEEDMAEIEQFISQIHIEDGSKINLRSNPGTGSEIVTQVENGWQCSVTHKTLKDETIEGITDFWYHVIGEENVEGWVFGAYLAK